MVSVLEVTAEKSPLTDTSVAHAIIESYEPLYSAPMKRIQPAIPSTPIPYTFVFSATSEKSLAAQIKTYTHFLDENLDFDLGSLSWSLFRRTAFQFRVTFSATSIRSLITQLEAHLENVSQNKSRQVPESIQRPHRTLWGSLLAKALSGQLWVES